MRRDTVSFEASTHGRHLLIGMSLANLLFLPAWSELMPRNAYYIAPSITDYVALLTNVLCLGVLFGSAPRIVRRLGAQRGAIVVKLAFITALLVPANHIRRTLDKTAIGDGLRRLLSGGGVPLLLAGIVFAGITYCVARWHREISRAGTQLVLLLFPLMPFNAARVIWEAASLRQDEARPAPVIRDHDRPRSPRVVIIVLDELDYLLAFPERPSTVSLPELDALRRDALHATRAYSPDTSTLVSLPALTVGQLFARARPRGAQDLGLQDSTGAWKSWKGLDNVFSRAQQLGATTALAGWYHPYCRVLDVQLTRCAWIPGSAVIMRGGQSGLVATMFRQLLTVLPNSVTHQTSREHVRVYEALVRVGAVMASDPTLDLVLVHLPVPHLPPIYDRFSGAIALDRPPYAGYLDNLVLADQAVGLITRRIQAGGSWSNTAVIVTSDHSFRDRRHLGLPGDLRVPFIVRLPTDSTAVTYDRPFNTVITTELVLSILQGRIHTLAGLKSRLQAAASEAPVLPVHLRPLASPDEPLSSAASYH